MFVSQSGKNVRALGSRNMKRAEFTGQFLGFERERLLGGLAADQFRCQAGDGDGGFASERLKCGPVDNTFAVQLLELHPQAQHFAAIGIADRADGIRASQLAHVLRIGERSFNPLL